MDQGVQQSIRLQCLDMATRIAQVPDDVLPLAQKMYDFVVKDDKSQSDINIRQSVHKLRRNHD